MDGWISIHRKIVENPLYFSEPFTRMQAWIDMLIIANHKEGFFFVRGNKVIVKRGQIAYSQESLSERWKWSRWKVNKFLNDLEQQKQIVQQKNKVTTLISIVNYNLYQKNHTTDCTTDIQQTVQLTNTNNNETNVINKKEKEESFSPQISKRFLLKISEVENFLKSDEAWKEVVCMQNNCSIVDLDDHIHNFTELLKSRGETEKSPADAKSHFVNWLNKNPIIKDIDISSQKRKQYLFKELKEIVNK